VTRYVRESLWDVEQADLSTLRVSDCIVAPVSPRDVDEFSSRYHYTGTGGSALWRWGLWHGATLLGVVSYNNPTRDVQESIFGDEHHEHVWHMGRLALAEHAPRNSESRLIGGSLREIERLHPYVWAVVTFAAQDENHIGYVYQATNAIYTGTGGSPVYFVDGDGNRHSDYLSGHVNAARGEALGWTRHKSLPKHRYIYLLGSKTHRRHLRGMLRYPVLNYPKAAAMTTELEVQVAAVNAAADAMRRTRPFVIVVDAAPAPQGSKRHVGGGVLIESSRNVKPFRAAVAAAATSEALKRGPGNSAPVFGDAVSVSLTFTLPRPAAHYGRGKQRDVLRVDAPKVPAKRPDLDKLTRAVLDALTTAQIYTDDGLVVRLEAEKCYPFGALDALDDPGVLIVVQSAA
jgi:crossover junction endodeoxyribonuclease RusA